MSNTIFNFEYVIARVLIDYILHCRLILWRLGLLPGAQLLHDLSHTGRRRSPPAAGTAWASKFDILHGSDHNSRGSWGIDPKPSFLGSSWSKLYFWFLFRCSSCSIPGARGPGVRPSAPPRRAPPLVQHPQLPRSKISSLELVERVKSNYALWILDML